MEILGFEGGTANEAAVNVGLKKKFTGVSRFDTTAVEDRQGLSGFCIRLSK